MSVRRSLVVVATAGVAVIGPLAFVASAQSGNVQETTGTTFVVLTGRLEVRSSDTVDAAVIFDGEAVIEGEVTGTVMAFNGDVEVAGTVGGDVVALNGRVTVDDSASVGGDIVSSSEPDIARGADFDGEIRRQTANFDVEGFAFASRIAYWLAATVSSFLVGLLLVLAWPRAADAIAHTGRQRLGASIGWGVLMFFGVPVAAVILLVTLVGALLGVGLLLALVLIYSIGYTAGAFAFGRTLLKPPRNRFLAFLLGWGILRAAALIPVIGGLLFVASTVWGLGAIVVAAFRASRGPVPAVAVGAGPQGLPPMPPMPGAP